MNAPIIKVVNLKKWFKVRTSFFSSIFFKKQLFLRAVDGISFEIWKGQVFGLVGESGCGKTTTGKLLIRLIDPTDGKIYFAGKDITNLSQKELKPLRRKMQIIFQDPYASLDPRKTISDIVSEPLRIHDLGNRREIEEKVKMTLEDVKLTPVEDFLDRFPHELSGGQRQRVALARALILDPEFIVADEPVSMLDVSIRGEVLKLMLESIRKRGLSLLYITHDLALARCICNRIAVMYLGKIVEEASTHEIVHHPLHPYTKALISAVPVPDPTSQRSELVIRGQIPSPISPPSGCRFHPRCPEVIGEICRTKEPPLVKLGNNHIVACHKYT